MTKTMVATAVCFEIWDCRNGGQKA